MPRWIEQVDQLLYDGEDVAESLELGAGGVVVTSHRVLVFTPQADGANYDHVDRPNVLDVTRRTSGEANFLELAVRAGGIGLVLLLAGLVIDMDSLLGGIGLGGSGTGASELGIGGVLESMQSMLGLLAKLDDLLVIFGGLAIVFALIPLAVYLWSRESELVIAVAGDEDDLVVPVDESVAGENETDETVERLRRAVFPEGVPDPPPR